MTDRYQNGFAVVESLLVLVIVGLIGGTGYYVWHSKQVADKTLTVSSGSKKLKVSTTKQTDATATWFAYTAPSNHYSIHLADGWKLTRYKQEDALFTFTSADTQYTAGTKASVTTVSEGTDGSGVGLFIGYISLSDETTAQPKGQVTGTFKTNQGLEVTCYSYTETSSDPENQMGGVPKGGKIYSYTAAHSGAVMLVAYGIGPGDSDQHAVVEQSVKTFTFN